MSTPIERPNQGGSYIRDPQTGQLQPAGDQPKQKAKSPKKETK